MPTPPKPANVILMEGKSHRTKSEIRQREQAEKSLLSGDEFKERKEVKQNKIAHKEFLRIKKILKKIGKNDALYEPILNRYCMIQAECQEFQHKREKFFQQICDFEKNSTDMIDRKEMTWAEYFKTQASMQTTLINLDKQVQSKRKMLLDIEKENIMTIASALRSVPKKVEKKKNPLLEALNG